MKAKRGSKARRFLLQSRKISFTKHGDYFSKAGDIFCKARILLFQSGALSVPNLTFEREEEVKGVNFGGQTFAGPTQHDFQMAFHIS